MAAEEEETYIKNPPEIMGVEDLSGLVYMEMPNVIDTLQYRWQEMQPKRPYTSVSTILIAVNPYEWVTGIYSDDLLQKFYQEVNAGKANLSPHPYAVGARSYTRMMHRSRNQSVIVCGESGAGKTETTKRVIQYLAKTTPSGGTDVGDIETRIIQISPILEAMGNAKTLLNNNSSRFGKFTKVMYTAPGSPGVVGAIVGSELETYLLEKSRVIFQSPNERNYHSFYFAKAGLEQKGLLDDYGVGDLMDFWYTQQGGCSTVDGISDIARFEELEAALNYMHFDEVFQENMWKTLMGILHLGNIGFTKDGEGNGRVDEGTMAHVDYFCQLMGLSQDDVVRRMEQKSMKVMKKKIFKNINFKESANNRDAIAKGVYNQIFLYLAERINSDLSDVEASAGTSYLFIGILDVFGFENFEMNSLEQFCINFTNEKLQDFFNVNIIQSEQEEYLREGVLWSEVDVPNSQPMIDLVEDNKTGLFFLLDSACNAPEPNVEAFHQEFFDKHKKSDIVSIAKSDGKQKRGKKKKKGGRGKKGYFGATFEHFADIVTYNFENFLAKNMEKVSDDTKEMFNTSSNPVAKECGGGKIRKKKSRKKTSLTSTFSKQLKKLMANLKATEPYFIRCVNPNKVKSSTIVNRQVLRDQLTCGGILQALAVLAKGYPTRVEYKILYERFRPNISNPLIRNLPEDKFAAAVLVAFDVNEDEYELGMSKIFFKPAKAAVLEEIMESTEELSQEQIDKVIAWLAQRRILQLFGVLKVGSHFINSIRDSRAEEHWKKAGTSFGHMAYSLKRYLHAREKIDRRNKKNAATAIQRYWRAYKDRQAYDKKLKKHTKAIGIIWREHNRYQQRVEFMDWLTKSVEATRIKKEEERIRREEEARRIAAEKERQRKEEEERLRKIAEEKARQEAELAAANLAAEEAQKERLRIAAEQEKARIAAEKKAAEDREKAAEEARLREIEFQKEQICKEVRRVLSLDDTKTEAVSSGDSEKAVLDFMRSKVDSVAEQEVNKASAVDQVPEEVEAIKSELVSVYQEIFQQEVERKQKEEEDRIAKEAKAKEEAEKAVRRQEQQRTHSTMMSEQNKKELMAKKLKRRQEKKKQAEIHVMKKEMAEMYAEEEKAEDALSKIRDIGREHVEEEEENEVEENQASALEHAQSTWDMERWKLTAANGQMFKKHKYRRKAQDAAKRFIKIEFNSSMETPKRIVWGTGNRNIKWSEVKLVAYGCYTPTFVRQQQQGNVDERCCLSVVSQNTILDISYSDHAVVWKWCKGLRELLGQSDAEAKRLQEELRSNPPVKKAKKKPENKSEAKTEDLIILQKDLFVMTTTTVFRNLEEEYYPITPELKAAFDPNLMYTQALGEDVPWRQWQNWIKRQILDEMKNRGLLGSTKGAAAPGAPNPGTAQGTGAAAGGPGQDNEKCIIS